MIGKKHAQAAADELSKKLGLNVRFYGKSFSLLTIGHATTILRGIASTYLVARWVSPEILGQFRYMITLYGLAGVFSLGGYGSTMIKGLAKGDSSSVHYAIRKTLTYAPLGSVFLLLMAFERFYHGEQIVAWAIVVSALSFVPYTLCSFYVSILTGLERIKDLTLVNVWANIIYAIAFTIILLISKNLIVLTVAYFAIDIIVRGWMSWRAFKQLPPSNPINAVEKNVGNHLNWIMVMVTITGSISQILLQRVWGYAALATFSVAMILPEQLMNLAKTMSGTILQRLSKQELNEKNLLAVKRHFWNSLIGSAVLIFAYAIMAPFVIPLFFPQYKEAVLPSIVYAIGLLAIPSLIGVYFFQAHGNIRSMWKFHISSSIIQLVTSITLVPFLGQWGAIWSRVITRLGSLPFSYPSMPKRVETSSDSDSSNV